MPIVHIPKALTELANGHSRIELQGQTPSELILEMRRAHPALHNALVGDNGSLRPFITLIIDGEVVVDPSAISAWRLAPLSEVRMLSAIAGG
jgi:hypothetical protein